MSTDAVLPLVLLSAAVLLTASQPARRLSGAGTGGGGAGPGHAPAPPRRLALLAPVAVGAATLVFLLAGRISIMIAAAIAAVTAGFIVDAVRTRRRANRIDRTLVAVLGHVVADLRAGSLIGTAFARAARDLPDSTPGEITDTLHAVAAHVSRGGSGHQVLARRDELAGVSRMWSIAESHGLPAAELLEQARARLSAKQAHRGSTSASLQGPQATAGILALLPLVGVGLGASMGADPLGLLFGGGIGGILLVAGTALICGGVLVSAWIIGKASP